AERAAEPAFRERFERESRLTAAIDHPNVSPDYAAGEEAGRLYLVMRNVAGTDLRSLLERDGRLAPHRAADAVAQVGAGPGAPPFRRDTIPATSTAHLHDPPPRPSEAPGVPPEFDAVVARALAKRPDDRYPSAGDLGRAALAAARGERATESEHSVARGPA